MTREQAIALLEARDPIAAAQGIAPPHEVGWLRAPADGEGVAQVRYGAGTTPAQVADRLMEIARQPSAARAVLLVPGTDSGDRPGSWGNEDLLVAAVARRVLPVAWLYAVSVAITAAVAWEVCAYSMLGFWNGPRLIWPCAGVGMLSVLACAVAFGLERAHPGLTSHHFRPDD